MHAEALQSRLCTPPTRCTEHKAGVARQVKEEGYEVDHGGNCITVFSAPNYVDQMGNKGALIRFTGGDLAPQFTTFSAVPHPDVKPMQYANPFLGGMFGL